MAIHLNMGTVNTNNEWTGTPDFEDLNKRLSNIKNLQGCGKHTEAKMIINILVDEALTSESFEGFVSANATDRNKCAYKSSSGLGAIVDIGCSRIEKVQMDGQYDAGLRDEVFDTVVMWLCDKELLHAESNNLVGYLVNRISYIGDTRDFAIRNIYGLHRIPVVDQAAKAVHGRKIHNQVFTRDLMEDPAAIDINRENVDPCTVIQMNKSVEETIFGSCDVASEHLMAFAEVITDCVRSVAVNCGYDFKEIINYALDSSIGSVAAKDYGDTVNLFKYLSHPFYLKKFRAEIHDGFEKAGISRNFIEEFEENTRKWTGKYGFKNIICASISITMNR